MSHLIDKSDVVAEIEKYYNECLKRAKIIDSDYWNAKADAYRNVLVILDDSLEIKEVDLEEEIDNYLDENFYISETWGIFSEKTENEINRSDLEDIAKYFFELGMAASNKVQEGE